MSLILLEGYPSTRGLFLFTPGFGKLSPALASSRVHIPVQPPVGSFRPNRPGKPVLPTLGSGVTVGNGRKPRPSVGTCRGVGGSR